MEPPGGNRCAYTPKQPVVLGLIQHVGLIAKGAHIAVHARSGCTGYWRLPLLLSHKVMRVAPNLKLDNTYGHMYVATMGQCTPQIASRYAPTA